jgi:SAM-dependent methyltransferase
VTIPYPPLELASRVGSLTEQEDPYAFYDLIGRECRNAIVSLLPNDWSWEGVHVLDFGAGAGRTLRHFLDEAERATFWACDIDRESVAWLVENLSPPIRAFVSEEEPPLPLDAGSLDLIYAVSVFTHLTDTWSAWLLELHRLLKESGLLVLTFIGPGAARHVTDLPWDSDRIGMTVLKPGQSWDLGGPIVLHSPWWIVAHWGRAFEIDELHLDGFGLPPPEGQGVVLMRKRDVQLDRSDLERLEEGEPREAIAAASNVRQLSRELVNLSGEFERLSSAWRGEAEARTAAEQREIAAAQALERIATSKSWRLTHPLRWLAKQALPSRRREARVQRQAAGPPMPPLDLVFRVGTPPDGDPLEVFDAVGRAERTHLLGLLPDDWSFANKRVLDFGCGAGRTLRHFLPEAQDAEIWGCDIDAPSIEWVKENLSPPIHAFTNEENPPLPFDSDSFHLVFALSVFSHLAENWAAWLVELHRLLIDEGLLIATFHGRGTWKLGVAGSRGRPFDEDRIGMHVEHYGSSFEDSWGPAVYLSEWWLEAHWGRAFDIVAFEPEGFATGEPNHANAAGQGTVVLRKKPIRITPETLETPSEDPRELSAALASRDLVYRELAITTEYLHAEIKRLKAEQEVGFTGGG